MTSEELEDAIQAASAERERWHERSEVRHRRLEDLLTDLDEIQKQIGHAYELRKGLKEGERHEGWSEEVRQAREHELTQLVQSLGEEHDEVKIRVAKTREGIDFVSDHRERLTAHIKRWEKELASRQPEFGDPAIPRFGAEIDMEQQRVGMNDLALACAIVEQEVGGFGWRNIFGCDQGSILCNQDVTEARVQQLINHVQNGGIPNGVGLTQLTSLFLVERAEAYGGAHLPRFQLRVGFEWIGSLIRNYGLLTGLGAYNGGEGNPQMKYAREVDRRREEWQARLG